MLRSLKYLIPTVLALASGSSALACGPAYYPAYQCCGSAPITVIVIVKPEAGSGSVGNASNNSSAAANNSSAANNSRASNAAANNSAASSNAANNTPASNNVRVVNNSRVIRR